MNAVKNVLVVGGGFSGMSAAIEMRKVGIDVDLVEIDADWRSYGAGISISGPTLRALGAVGVLPQVAELGCLADGCDIFTAAGQKIASLPTPRLAGADFPGGGGIMRPTLASILSAATRRSGTRVRLGCTFTSLVQDAEGVDATFSDGSTDRYDLVVGADGLYSKTRSLIFPHSPPVRYTGQGIWRAVVPRPRAVLRISMYMGRRTKAGFNPVSDDQMYVFTTEDRPTNEHVAPEELLPQFSALLEEFTAPVLIDMRKHLGADSQIVYRPLESILMPLPWSNGRVILIGDAAHATTPHLASGAGIGIEDAIVLAAELKAASSLTEALQRFCARRFERCRTVVENSLRLGDIERNGGSQAEHGEIMRATMMALAQEI